ncbi:hypothetical protein E9993_09330 [Labilibacter sediminis]|nr:hypothetical protein E9993_09330 [Labilibacter sediminis]
MEGMSKIVKTATGLLCGVVFMYGLYIITHGHLTPGGGFAGGVLVAGSFILLILAYGSDVLMLRKEETESSVTESSAILIVLILAVIGMFAGGAAFMNNYFQFGEVGELISAGVIPLYNIFIGMEVASALLTIFLAFVIYKKEVLK